MEKLAWIFGYFFLDPYLMKELGSHIGNTLAESLSSSVTRNSLKPDMSDIKISKTDIDVTDHKWTSQLSEMSSRQRQQTQLKEKGSHSYLTDPERQGRYRHMMFGQSARNATSAHTATPAPSKQPSRFQKMMTSIDAATDVVKMIAKNQVLQKVDDTKHDYDVLMHGGDKSRLSAGLGLLQTGVEVGSVVFPVGRGLQGGAANLRSMSMFGRMGEAFAGNVGAAARMDAVEAMSMEHLVPSGSVGSVRAWTTKARLKTADLPIEGKIRFVPDRDYHPSEPLLRGPRNGYLDRFGNEWVKGPSRTVGQPFEWDVQLSRLGKKQLGWASRDESHLNISLDGRITHK